MKYELKNPFRFGEVVSDRHFTNRKKEIKELRSIIQSGQNIVLLSPRRYGKSSLIAETLKGINQRSVVIDLETINSELELAHMLMRKLLQGKPLDKLSRLFKDFKIKPTVNFNPMDGSVQFSYNAASGNIKDYCLDAYSLAGKMGTEKKPLIVVFDEFQEIRRIGKDMERLLRGTFQHHKNVCYIFIGSNRQMISDIFQNQKNPFYKFGKHITLSRISHTDFSNYLEEKFLKIEKDVKGLCDGILGFTGCHPYYTQQIAFEIFALLVEGEKAAGPEIVKTATRRIVVNHNAEFAQWWRARNNTDRKVLSGLAEGQHSYGTQKFLLANELTAVSTVISSLERMYHGGILEQDEKGKYFIEDIFFKEWIRYRRGFER